MFIRFFMLGANHRLATVLFLAMVTCITGLGLPRLDVDTGFSSLMPDSHPDKRIYEQIVREFGSDNRSIVYVKDKDLWSKEKLAALEKLHFALKKLDCVKQVDDLFTMRSIRGTKGEIDSRIILKLAPENQAAIDQARADALSNPTLVDTLISRDGTALAIVVSFHDSLDKKASHTQINTALETAITPFNSAFQKIFQVGPPRTNATMETLLFDDLKLLGPLSAIALVAGIFFFLGSGFAAIVPLITSGLSLVWTGGIMGWTHIPLNILTAMLPTLVIIIGSAADTHMMISYFQGVTRAKKNHRSFATQFMMKHMGVPLILTVLTTAMGFASNMFSSIGIIQNFAISATIAILANGMINWLFVPMIFSWLGPGQAKGYGNKTAIGLPAVFIKLFGATNRRFALSILGITALLCAVFGYECSKLYVTNDPLSYFKKNQPLVTDARTLHQDLAGMNFFYISLTSTRDKAFLLPENIKRLTTIQDFITEQGVFDSSLSLADHLSLVNREFHGGNPEYHEVPDRENLVAQYLLFFHRRDLKNYVSHDLKRACIVVRHNISDSSQLNRHIRELKEVVPRIAGPGMTAHIVGENLMINGAAEDLIRAQVKSLIILLFLIFIITSIMFTSVKGGIIALIPSLIPVILMFGTMGFLQIPLNPGTIMVAVISIGIAVDGTLHLFSRYNELCRRTSDYENAVLTTVREEATPLVITSLALALGFSILLFSKFTIIAQFGALSAATMIFALFANLLITPIIMSRVRLVGLYQILALKMHHQVLEKSPLFNGMTNYQMRKAILISELNEFEQGQLLVEQGAQGRSMYLILSGTAEVIRKKGNEERCLVCLGPGQIFGEIGYVRQIRRTANVRAASPVAVLRFDYLKLEQDLKFFPFIIAKLNFNISCILGERLADANDALDEQDLVDETNG
jgi:uncharacterized protein